MKVRELMNATMNGVDSQDMNQVVVIRIAVSKNDLRQVGRRREQNRVSKLDIIEEVMEANNISLTILGFKSRIAIPMNHTQKRTVVSQERTCPANCSSVGYWRAKIKNQNKWQG